MYLERRLSVEEWLLIGYVLGVLVYWTFDMLTSTSGSGPGDREERVSPSFDSVRLTEPALDRLEAGDSIAVDRWHGGELVLSGDVVLDVQGGGVDE